MSSSGMCHCVVLVRTDISEERIASIFRVKTVSELKTQIEFEEVVDLSSECLWLYTVWSKECHTSVFSVVWLQLGFFVFCYDVLSCWELNIICHIIFTKN
jgi:hypothetical protein